jgi:hypothetical protein
MSYVVYGTYNRVRGIGIYTVNFIAAVPRARLTWTHISSYIPPLPSAVVPQDGQRTLWRTCLSPATDYGIRYTIVNRFHHFHLPTPISEEANFFNSRKSSFFDNELENRKLNKHPSLSTRSVVHHHATQPQKNLRNLCNLRLKKTLCNLRFPSLCVILSLIICVILSSVSAVGKPFRFPQDTFAFTNETYLAYRIDASGQLHISPRQEGQKATYSRECFVLTRSILQFHKFAEFNPKLPKISEAEYRQKLLQLNRIPAWKQATDHKIIFPGYSDLWSFSAVHTLLLEKHLGNWWPTYFRLGNWPMALPFPRWEQASLARWLTDRMDKEGIQTVFMTRFKPLNHCLVAYHYARQPNGDVIFDVCDVNQPGKLVHLSYRAATRSFYFDKSWYYPGGVVNIMKLYISPLS